MIKFPFTTLQQFNLDWIMQQLRKILDFMPLNGSAGDVLQRTADGAAWQPIAAISMDIHSLQPIGDDVAGNDELPLYDNSAQSNYKATVTEIMKQAPVQSVNGLTGDVVLTIPAVPVDSVNGQTGTVVLDAADVGALPDTTAIPDDTSDLTNGAGFVDAAGAAAAAPVQSVNGQTGAVVLDAADVSALPDTYTPPVTSVNGQTGDVLVSGALDLTLLWTNPDPTVDYAGSQLISLDLTDYELIMIETIEGSWTESQCTLVHIPTPVSGYSTQAIVTYVHGSSYTQRSFGVSAVGVSVGIGFSGTYNTSTQTSDNGKVKPYRIFGIK